MAVTNVIGAGVHPDSLAIHNRFVNPDFEIWQRGTSFVSPTTSTFTADQMVYSKAGSMVHNIDRSTAVPPASSGHNSLHSILLTVTTADTSLAASDESFIGQNVEGYNFRDLAQQHFTLSFWVRATKTGIHCVAFRNDGLGGDPDRSYIAEYTIDAANTWEYKTITVPPSPSDGSWDYETLRGIRVTWCLACGTDFQTTADAWQTGNFLGTSNQVNTTDAINNEFRLGQIQLEAGKSATPFRTRSFAQEVALCQRYYEKSYDLDVDPGTVTNIGRELFRTVVTGTGFYTVKFVTSKRVAPSITIYNPNDGAVGTWRNSSASSDLSTTAGIVGMNRTSITITSSTAGHLMLGQWVANAEL